MASLLIPITAIVMILVKKSFRLHFEKEYHNDDICMNNTLLNKIHNAARVSILNHFFNNPFSHSHFFCKS